MRKTRPEVEEKGELEMTPMIDVTFLLLVFFLCTLRFKSLDAKLEAHLPREGAAATEAEVPERVTFAIRVVDPGTRVPREDGTGAHDFDATRRVEFRVGPHRTLDAAAARARLAALHAADPERGVRLDPDSNAVAAEVVQAVDLALAAGFTDLVFAPAR